MDLGMMLIKAIVVGMVFVLIGGFFIWKFSKDTIDKDLNRLNKETEAVRSKQTELNEKIKQASEELSKRKAEADALVVKMTEDAEKAARDEREKLVNKARQEGEEIIVKANNTKEDIRKSIVKEMDMKAVDFTALILNEVLSKEGRTALDECMITEFIESLVKLDMEMIGEDIKTADIVTASALSERMRNLLSETLLKKLGRTIAITATTDPKILSGMILRFGSLALDGSLKSMVRESATGLKEKLEKGLL